MTTKTVWLSDVKSAHQSYSVIVDFIGDEFLSFEEDTYYESKFQSDELSEAEDKIYHTKLESNIALKRRIWDFEQVPREILPKQAFFGNKSAEKKRLPVIMKIMSGYLLVHQSVVEIFQQHRLGQTQLSALTIYSHDMTTPLYEDYYFLNIAERQSFLDPEACEHDLFKTEDGRYLSGSPEKKIAVNSAALSCEVDIWHDSLLKHSIFISDALHNDLKRHKLTRRFEFFPPCIITG